jgi:type I restriction enzyme S subunit
MGAIGNIPKDDRWKSKYRESVKPETSDLPALPGGWVWLTLSQAAEIQGGIQKQPKRRPIKNYYPYLRVANVLRNKLDLTEVHEIELFGDELGNLRLKAGDLLIVEGNGSPTEIGRMAIWNEAIDNCVHQNHIIRARPLGELLPTFIASYWNSPEGSRRVMHVASSTSGLYTLSVSKVSQLPIPIPPVAEQRRIIAEVERRFSVIDELEAVIAANLKRSDRLRQAILKHAFEGKLVPQDLTDEPASVLLERIRAEREQAIGKPKATPQRTKAHEPTVPPKATTPVQGELALGFHE